MSISCGLRGQIHSREPMHVLHVLHEGKFPRPYIGVEIYAPSSDLSPKVCQNAPASHCSSTLDQEWILWPDGTPKIALE